MPNDSRLFFLPWEIQAKKKLEQKPVAGLY